MKRVLYISFLAASLASAAEPRQVSLRLGEVEEAAERSSRSLQAAQAAWEAARDRAAAAGAARRPALDLQADYRYSAVVPSFRPLPSAPVVRLGDNTNYSVGPALSWTAWDAGAARGNQEGLERAAESLRQALAAARLRVRHSARLTYFQVQHGLEQMRLLADSLKLARSQYKDTAAREKAGTVSRIDTLSAHQEELARLRDLRQAQTDMALALDDLAALTGLGEDWDTERPAGRDAADVPVEGLAPPTLLVSLEDVAAVRARLEPAAARRPSATHPDAQVYAELAEASERSARGLDAGRWPELRLSGKLSRDYPNGPVLEDFTQRTAQVSARWSLWDGGRRRRLASEQKLQAESRREQAGQSRADIWRDWRKAKDHLAGLGAERAVEEQAAAESRTLADLIYAEYKAGRSTYLEVQAANLRVLASRSALERTDIQILIQLATLDSLTAEVSP